MNVIVVGSVAGRYHRCIPKRNKLLDIDIISDYKSALVFTEARIGDVFDEQHTPTGVIFTANTSKGVLPVEVELIEKREHTKYLYEAIRSDMTKDELCAPKEWLRFMKESHKYKKDSPHFFKTLCDLHYMRDSGIKMPWAYKGLLAEREKLTYTNSLPKLNVGKDDFFKKEDNIYIYSHDDIHKIVALDGAPAYTQYMQEGSEVMTSKEKFFALPERVRLLGGLEEALVLTAERSLIPHEFKPDPDTMFRFALSKVCTSITGGWFREYCYDNFFKIMSMYRKECSGKWVASIREAIDKNELPLYNSNSSIY